MRNRKGQSDIEVNGKAFSRQSLVVSCLTNCQLAGIRMPSPREELTITAAATAISHFLLPTRFMMAILNNTTSPTPLIPTQVSVLDFFIPGSTGILAAIEPVLAMNSSVRPLLLCILLVFLCRYIWVAAETHFGPSPCRLEDAY